MTAPKGYSGQKKLERLSAQFTTVEPVREQQFGLSVNAHMYVTFIVSDAVEAGSTTSVINATAHVAKVGDVLRITSGALLNKEVKVWAVTANTITLAEDLVSAPAAAVSFDILRPKYPMVDSDGNINVATSPSPLIFVRNGVDVEVTEDTVTPANNLPLPVKLTSVTGDINITAGDLNVQLSDQGANPDVTKIGDGTNRLGITASSQARVAVETSVLPTGAATETTLSAINTKTATLVSGRVPVDPSGVTSPISAASLPLPTGAATEATLATRASETTLSTLNGKIPSNLTVTSTRLLTDGSGVTQPISAASLPLPTGAATETTLAALSAKFNSLGQKTSANSAPVVLASDQSAIPVIGTKLDVISTVLLNAATTTINGSAGALVQLVASTTGTTKAIQILDTTGGYIGIYTGAAASEVLKVIAGPGSDQTIECAIPASTRLTIRRLDSTTALTVGIFAINFLG